MNFTSDNVTGVAPAILEALVRANAGSVPSYGGDPLTLGLDSRFSALFEREVAVFPVVTGTAANALALSVLTPPFGAVYCHEDSHIHVDECGAPELFSGGAKLVPLGGPATGPLAGKLTAAALEQALAATEPGFVHAVQPAAVSLTQATEMGTVYTPDEVAGIAAVAHGHGLRLHMDGARFANAVAALGCAPADLTWRAGIDVLSFGATKNGALAAEAVVFFDPGLAHSFGYRRKRGGHLISKMRFVSAQLDAYLADGLWLRLAGHANAMAARLAAGLAAIPGVRPQAPTQANELFVELPEPVLAGLEAAGVRFYRWDGRVARFVTAWNSDPAEIDRLAALAASFA